MVVTLHKMEGYNCIIKKQTGVTTMMYESKENVRYMGNGFYAVDIGNGKTLVLRNDNVPKKENREPFGTNKTYGYIKKENGKSDFGEWLNIGRPTDLIDEKELIRKFVSSGKDGVMSYKINGKTHLLLMLGNSFYHYTVDDNDALSSKKKMFKRYEITVTDRFDAKNPRRFFTDDISKFC